MTYLRRVVVKKREMRCGESVTSEDIVELPAWCHTHRVFLWAAFVMEDDKPHSCELRRRSPASYRAPTKDRIARHELHPGTCPSAEHFVRH